MIATLITGDPDPEDVRKYFRALKRAQFDIDLRPELYTHFYKKEFPERFHPQMDTRRWGPGERIVFEAYTRQAFEDSFTGSPSEASSPKERWDRAITKRRRFRLTRLNKRLGLPGGGDRLAACLSCPSV